MLIATSYQPKTNVETTLKRFLGSVILGSSKTISPLRELKEQSLLSWLEVADVQSSFNINLKSQQNNAFLPLHFCTMNGCKLKQISETKKSSLLLKFFKDYA